MLQNILISVVDGGLIVELRFSELTKSQSKGTSFRGGEKRVPKILTDDYVRELNRGIAYRIRQHEAAHAGSEELAAKARFR